MKIREKKILNETKERSQLEFRLKLNMIGSSETLKNGKKDLVVNEAALGTSENTKKIIMNWIEVNS